MPYHKKYVLLILSRLTVFDGTTSYNYTLANLLQQQGYLPIFISNKLGRAADFLKKRGFKVNSKIGYHKAPSLIFINNNINYYTVKAHYPHLYLFFLSHSPFYGVDLPPIIYDPALHIIATSNEVKNQIISLLPVYKAKIIATGNPVNVSHHLTLTTLSKNILVLGKDTFSQQASQVLKSLKDFHLTFIGYDNQSTDFDKVDSLIKTSSVVISVGRGVLEAISQKRLAVVWNNGGPVDIVTDRNFNALAQTNFSGRGHKNISIKQITSLISDYLNQPHEYNLTVEKNQQILKNSSYNVKNLWLTVKNHKAKIKKQDQISLSGINLSQQISVQNHLNQFFDIYLASTNMQTSFSIYSSRGWQIIQKLHQFRMFLKKILWRK